MLLLQCLPDTVEEEGVLLDSLPLEVVLELIEQLCGHLEGNSSPIFFHGVFSLRFIIFCDEFSHVLAQRLSGRLLPLAELCVEFNWDRGT